MSFLKPLCLVALTFFTAEQALAQYAHMERESAGTPGHFFSLEYKPLTALMFATPGGSGYGAEMELKVYNGFYFAGGILALGANPNDEQFQKKIEKDKPKEDELVVRRSSSQVGMAGMRWYHMPSTSSFYAGAKIVTSTANSEYAFDDGTNLNEKTTFTGPGGELGYRWLFNMISVRLGLNFFAESGKKSKLSSDSDAGEFEVAQGKIEKENEKNKDKTKINGGIDFGVGVVF